MIYDFLDWFAQDWLHVVVLTLLLGFLYGLGYLIIDMVDMIHYRRVKAKNLLDLGYPPSHCDADGYPVTREYQNN